MVKNWIILIFTIVFISCSSEEDCGCTIIDTSMSVRYLNQMGDNLFEIENGYDFSQIKVYHKINGVWVEYFGGGTENPKGIKLIERNSETFLVIFPSNTIVENDISETKLQFSDTDIDVIRSEIDKNNLNEIVTKVWYDDELKWETGESERMFSIIK